MGMGILTAEYRFFRLALGASLAVGMLFHAAGQLPGAIAQGGVDMIRVRIGAGQSFGVYRLCHCLKAGIGMLVLQNLDLAADQIAVSVKAMLSILASFAQAESQSVSENQKWRVKKNFQEGKPWDGTLLGYRYYDGRYVIEPTEAETVRRIYREYLSGKGTTAIANGLNADGVPTRLGGIWHKSAVMKILKNYTYTGNLLLQKTYREDYISKETVPNNGEMPMYHATDTHEAIIDLDVFDAVQAEIERRSKKYTSTKRNYAARYPFSGMIVCGNCGKHYRRKTTAGGIVWICTTFNTQGKAACPSKQIPEEKLYEMTADIDLGDVDCIIAENGNVIRIRMKDGSEITRHWTDRSRAESWTDEMKEQARQKQLERSKRNG